MTTRTLASRLTTRTIGMLALAPAFFLSTCAFAAEIIENGDTRDIDPINTPVPTDYVVRENSVLNVNGATTQSITVQTGSTLNINGGTVNGNPGGDGITVNTSRVNETSRANIANATVTADDIALVVNRAPSLTEDSQVTAVNSDFFGGDAGAAVTAFSTLELINSNVIGTGAGSAGLFVSGGSARATAGTHISGDAAGVIMDRDSNSVGAATLVLDGASAEGRNGPAILVDEGIDATIQVLTRCPLED